MGRMWLYQVFRLTLLSNPELGGVLGDAVTPGVMAGPGAFLRFLEETSPAPWFRPHRTFIETWPLVCRFSID